MTSTQGNGERVAYYMDGPGVTAESGWDVFTIRGWFGYD